MRPYSFDGAVAIVFGGSGGIGTSVAGGLLDAGAHVVIVARRDEQLRRTAALLAADDDHLLAMSADVADDARVGEIVGRVLHRFGRLDVLVHLAAEPVGIGDPTLSIDPSAWRRSVEVNLNGAFHTTRHALAPMVKQDDGVIVHVASTAVERPFPGGGPYGAAKAGVRHLIETLAQELDGTGVRVNGINAGPADTPTFRAVRSALMPERRDWPGPLSRRDPGDAARIILWLCSPAGRHLSGAFVSWRDPQVRLAMSNFSLGRGDVAAR
jgi:NAD(P)-dependent dehydrogenase (short-subunit alcohol dehydrogenase family)